MMRTTSSLFFVFAIFLTACAWGEKSTPGGGDDDGPKPDAANNTPVCGDGVCAASETSSCTADCGTPPACNNNGTCDPGETTNSCASDCTSSGTVCGDTVCDMAGGENTSTCPSDCGGGGGSIDCNSDETTFACFVCLGGGGCQGVTEDQCNECFGGGGGTGCGDGVCDAATEDPSTCPFDCM